MEIIRIPRRIFEGESCSLQIDKHFLACVANGDIYSEPCMEFKKDLNYPNIEILKGAWD